MYVHTYLHIQMQKEIFIYEDAVKANEREGGREIEQELSIKLLKLHVF